MGTVTIREFRDSARDRIGDRGTGLSVSELVTDEFNEAIKTATSNTSTAVMIGPLEVQTHFIQIETTAKLRYAILPKSFIGAPTWSASATYYTGQRVLRSGFWYTALSTTTPAAVPESTPAEWSVFAATASHIPLAANAVAMEAVYPGAYLSVLEMV